MEWKRALELDKSTIPVVGEAPKRKKKLHRKCVKVASKLDDPLNMKITLTRMVTVATELLTIRGRFKIYS